MKKTILVSFVALILILPSVSANQSTLIISDSRDQTSPIYDLSENYHRSIEDQQTPVIIKDTVNNAESTSRTQVLSIPAKTSLSSIKESEVQTNLHSSQSDSRDKNTNIQSNADSSAPSVDTSSSVIASNAVTFTDPNIEFSSSLNVTTVTVNDETDVSAVRYHANLTAVGKINISLIPIDYILVLDGSGSVGPIGWSKTISWAIDFVNSVKSTDRIGIVTFSTGATVLHSLNDNQDRIFIKNKLLNTNLPTGWTYTKDAINTTIIEFDTYSLPSTPKFLFLVTDGNPLAPQGQPDQDPCPLADDLQFRDISTLIIGVGQNWDSENLVCLVENQDTDIIYIDDYQSLNFNPEDLSAVLRNLVNVTATNINLTLVMDPANIVSSYTITPTEIIGNSVTWLFDRMQENDTYIIDIEFLVSGSGSVPIVMTGSILEYRPVNSTLHSIAVDTYAVEIVVIPPIEDLFNTIRDRILSLDLNNGNTNALLVKLDHAYQDYLAGNYDDAIQHLNTLMKNIDALTNPKRISLSDAEAIKALTQQLIDLITMLE